jgi:hypothetical protein
MVAAVSGVGKPRGHRLDGWNGFRSRHLHPAAHKDVVDAICEPIGKVRTRRHDQQLSLDDRCIGPQRRVLRTNETMKCVPVLYAN